MGGSTVPKMLLMAFQAPGEFPGALLAGPAYETVRRLHRWWPWRRRAFGPGWCRVVQTFGDRANLHPHVHAGRVPSVVRGGRTRFRAATRGLRSDRVLVTISDDHSPAGIAGGRRPGYRTLRPAARCAARRTPQACQRWRRSWAAMTCRPVARLKRTPAHERVREPSSPREVQVGYGCSRTLRTSPCAARNADTRRRRRGWRHSRTDGARRLAS